MILGLSLNLEAEINQDPGLTNGRALVRTLSIALGRDGLLVPGQELGPGLGRLVQNKYSVYQIKQRR